ncbi:MAG: 23S rRNA (pseudouridine(1915)-N(3))-methyltransferase RlmH [Bacteroidota bacterium]
MDIIVLAIGKTDNPQLSALMQDYENRLKRYISFKFMTIPDIKNRKVLSEKVQKEKESQLLLHQIQPADFLALLDEKGKQSSSREFSAYLQKRMNSGIKKLVFVIGGPYGFGQELHQRSNDRLSLSKMTFSHQMVRLFFLEQLYRAFTILKNEPYHHD